MPNSSPSSASGPSSLRRAVDARDIRQIELLLRSGADGREAGSTGITPLMAAAWGGWADGGAALVPVSDPRARDADGFDALMFACLELSAECARLLLPLSDLLAINAYGKSARDMAHDRDELLSLIEQEERRLSALAVRDEMAAAAPLKPGRNKAPPRAL